MMFLWQQLHFTKLSNEQRAHRGRLHTVMDWRREVSSCSDTCRVEGQAAINPSHSRSTLEKQGLIKFSFRLLLSFPSYPVFFFSEATAEINPRLSACLEAETTSCGWEELFKKDSSQQIVFWIGFSVSWKIFRFDFEQWNDLRHGMIQTHLEETHSTIWVWLYKSFTRTTTLKQCTSFLFHFISMTEEK